MSSSFVRRGRRFQQQQQQQHQLERKTLSATTEVDDDDDEGRRVRREDAKSDAEEHEKRKLKSEFENEERTKHNGTRPGAHGGVGGSRLISTGTEDLDDVLGSGLPLNAVFGIFLDDADDEKISSSTPGKISEEEEMERKERANDGGAGHGRENPVRGEKHVHHPARRKRCETGGN